MPAWLGVLEVVVSVVVLVALAVFLLAARRRWLARQGGAFECSARLRVAHPESAATTKGWALGVARYNGEMLEWFRFFSYAFRPRFSFRRADVRVVDHRDPDPIEAMALYQGQRVITLAAPHEPADTRWELAMDPESITGLLAWLEAAPPGVAPSSY